MFPSTLIVSSDSEILDREVNLLLSSLGHPTITNNPDIFTIGPDTGYTIANVREALSFVSRKPYNHQSKIILVYLVENLQNEAQNALLKTLEEPGDNNYLILTSLNSSSVLPTILSRCQVLKPAVKQKKIQGKLLQISGDTKTDLAVSGTLASDKQSALNLLHEQLSLRQQELITNPNPETALLIKKLIKTISMINQNVDYKSALDWFFLSSRYNP